MRTWFQTEDEAEARLLLNARRMFCALIEIQNQVRSWDKYEEREVIPVEEIRNTINDLIDPDLLEEV
jgi:hypothetical protein